MSAVISPQRLGKHLWDTTGYLHIASDKSSIHILAGLWLGTHESLHRAIQNIGAREKGNNIGKNQKLDLLLFTVPWFWQTRLLCDKHKEREAKAAINIHLTL